MRSQLRAIGGRPAVCRAVFKFQGELLQGQCLHAQAHGPRQRRGEIPPQPTSADKPMSNGTWRQDQLPAAALAARRPIRIEGSASAQAVKAQWLCTCYTWPGSNWRPSACEADVIATRPQVPDLKAEQLSIVRSMCGERFVSQAMLPCGFHNGCSVQ